MAYVPQGTQIETECFQSDTNISLYVYTNTCMHRKQTPDIASRFRRDFDIIVPVYQVNILKVGSWMLLQE